MMEPRGDSFEYQLGDLTSTEWEHMAAMTSWLRNDVAGVLEPKCGGRRQAIARAAKAAMRARRMGRGF